MVRFRKVLTRSWLDPNSARQLSAELAERLTNRFGNRSALFVTLTYDREPYAEAKDLYRAQSERRHVRRFIERLSKLLKVSLTGRWIRKMEFQEGGWVHWHFIIDHRGYIAPEVLQQAWPHGYSNAKRMHAGHAHYFAKYIAKEDAFPAWLLVERPRSVKVVACSPGFWNDTPSRPNRPSVKRPPSAFYVPLGCRLFGEGSDRVVVSAGVDPKSPRQTFHVSFMEAFRTLKAACQGKSARSSIPIETVGAWTQFWDVSFEVACRELARVCRRRQDPRAQARGPVGAFYLKQISNPPPSRDAAWVWEHYRAIGAVREVA